MPESYAAAVVMLGLLALVPGPDVAVVTRYAFSSGRDAAVRAALGVVVGLMFWGSLTVLGLAALLAASAEIYTAVKLAGAAYLVVMGARALWHSREPHSLSRAQAGGATARPMRAGLLTNLLNPKIAVFYTSVLPSLVPRGAPAAVWLAALVLTHAILSLMWLSGYAVVFSRGRSMLTRPRARQLLEAMTGAVLIAFGIRVAIEAR
jgi:threonine/homoserine/homoserine lactone efflux protein